MHIISVEPAIPDLHISRMEPCSAINSMQNVCGATPTSQYRKGCGVAAHETYVWLCPIHASICACGGGMCRDCYVNGGVVPVKLIRIDGPVRMLCRGAGCRATPLTQRGR
jgi:hypothetical protein